MTFQKRLLLFIREKTLLSLILGSLVFGGALNVLGYNRILTINQQTEAIQSEHQSKQAAFDAVFVHYKNLTEKMKSAETLGIDVTQAKIDRDIIRSHIVARDYTQATSLLKVLLSQLDASIAEKEAANAAAEAERLKAEEAARTQGTLTGKVTSDGVAISGATITVLLGSTTVTKVTTNTKGIYSFTVAANTYTLTISKSGYTTFRHPNTEIKAQQTLTLDIPLTKAAPTPITTSSGSGDSTAYSSYSQQTVNTSRGSFTADIMTFDLGSGHIRVVTDTASDNDCTNNCLTKSLSSYTSSNGGFAAINGTYFCPADYASCAGQTGYFYWKIFNSRLNKMINATNGAGEGDPFMTFLSSGQPHYYSSWNQFSGSIYAGINSKPRLIQGGANVLSDGDMDDKQRTVKSNRGALGLKGNTLYAVIARSATVPDLAEVMRSLGVDSAMNIDGGGSSAMIYKGVYKVGPGRNIPNAVIFVEQ